MSAQPEKDPQDALSFASKLSKLEEIVKQLESGELSLEESLLKFEEGIRLARSLETILARAESKVHEILKPGDKANPEMRGQDASTGKA